MQTCINVLAQIFTSAHFDMDLLMKASEINCGVGMYLLIAGLLALDTFMVRWDSEECHLNLRLSVVCDYCISWSYSLFLMALLLAV